MNQVDELRKGRPILCGEHIRKGDQAMQKFTNTQHFNQRRLQAEQACKIETYREQLQDVAEDPGSNWMDNRCRRYSLSYLLFHTIHEDRAHRRERGYPDAR